MGVIRSAAFSLRGISTIDKGYWKAIRQFRRQLGRKYCVKNGFLVNFTKWPKYRYM